MGLEDDPDVFGLHGPDDGGRAGPGLQGSPERDLGPTGRSKGGQSQAGRRLRGSSSHASSRGQGHPIIDPIHDIVE